VGAPKLRVNARPLTIRKRRSAAKNSLTRFDGGMSYGKRDYAESHGKVKSLDLTARKIRLFTEGAGSTIRLIRVARAQEEFSGEQLKLSKSWFSLPASQRKVYVTGSSTAKRTRVGHSRANVEEPGVGEETKAFQDWIEKRLKTQKSSDWQRHGPWMGKMEKQGDYRGNKENTVLKEQDCTVARRGAGGQNTQDDRGPLLAGGVREGGEEGGCSLISGLRRNRKLSISDKNGSSFH